jgi:hypothetical protein
MGRQGNNYWKKKIGEGHKTKDRGWETQREKLACFFRDGSGRHLLAFKLVYDHGVAGGERRELI